MSERALTNRTQSGPNVFHYDDFRRYLSDFFALRKAQNPKFSHRMFARMVGFGSPSHLLMILNGKRGLSVPSLNKLVQGLKLKSRERKYLETLVDYQTSKSMETRSQALRNLLELKCLEQDLYVLDRDRYEFLSNWYVVGIYVLIGCQKVPVAQTDLKKRFRKTVTSQQVHETYQVLTRLGLIESDSQGFWRQTQGAITVDDSLKESATFHYHRSMLDLAAEALRLRKLEDSEFSGATVSISSDQFPSVLERIRSFRKEINLLTSGNAKADQVYQLNIQFFSLTQKENSK